MPETEKSAAPEPGNHRGLIAEAFLLAREIRCTVDRELGPLGITAQQAGVLMITRLHEGCGVSELAEKLDADTAGMTRLVDRLEAKGLVVRKPSTGDRRMVVVRLTREGEELTPELISAFRRTHERLLAGIPDADVERLRDLMRRVRENSAAATQEVG